MLANKTNTKSSREEAERKGGETTAESYDKEFYQEIGQKGGEARANNQGSGISDSKEGKMSREEAGRKGGEKSGVNRKKSSKQL